MIRRRNLVPVLLATAVLLSACEATIVINVNEKRSDNGVPGVGFSWYLYDATKAHSRAMCAAGRVVPSNNATFEYRGESFDNVRELVARSTLSNGGSDADERNSRATDAIWDQWKADPTLLDRNWKMVGAGEAECNGSLWMTMVLRDDPHMPAIGRYITAQSEPHEVSVTNGIVYRSYTDLHGATRTLAFDLYEPLGAGGKRLPTIVLLHGGGFQRGSRTDMQAAARGFAQLGFVVASADYRLTKSTGGRDEFDVAISDALDDVNEAVRAIKAGAPLYNVDTSRVAVVGESAGGILGLGLAYGEDPTPASAFGQSPEVAAVVSAAATLNTLPYVPSYDAGDAPAMMLFHDQDTVWEEGPAFASVTCDAAHRGRGICDFRAVPGEGHEVPVAPGTAQWVRNVGPFLWKWLRLANAAR